MRKGNAKEVSSPERVRHPSVCRSPTFFATLGMLGAGTAQAARTCRNGVCGRCASRSDMPEWVCGRGANRSDMPEWVCSGGASRSTSRISVRRRRPQPLGPGIGARWPCVSPSSITERVRRAASPASTKPKATPPANLARYGGRWVGASMEPGRNLASVSSSWQS